MRNFRRILVIRLSSFGDVVLTYNFLKELKKTFPDTEIHFLVKEKYKQLLESFSFINKIITVSPADSLLNIRKSLNVNRYDLVFDLSNHLKTRILTLFLPSRKVRFKKDYFKKFFLIYFKINFFKDIIPVYKRYLLTLSKVALNVSHRFVPLLENLNPQHLLFDKYIVLAPSAGHFTKTFPKELFAKLFEKFSSHFLGKIVLVGDNTPADLEICSYLEARLNNCINLCGKTDFKQLISLVFYSEFVVCNDSGILHLSEAMNKKTFVFFGSTVKEFGFFPQLSTTTVFENNEIGCRPCTKIGRSSCPKKHFNCMYGIKINSSVFK
ncbi:MAG: glycosyltransferase family 9 protein [Ignavibacteria bacterium]